MTLRVSPDRHFIRTGHRSNRFVLAEVTAPAAVRTDRRPPVNLAFVLDRSGSMAGEKIRLARQAIEEAIGRLETDDRFAVVAYDDMVDVVCPSAAATPEACRKAIDKLREIDARNYTNLSDGWLRGCEQVAGALSEQGVNRVLLLTDGLANKGITDREELARHAGELRARGVTTSTFGVGDDFDEALLQSMASAAGGHFYYIASAAAIRDHISSEVGEALDVVARDVRLHVAVAEGVELEVLSPFATQALGRGVAVLLGDLVSKEVTSVVIRLRFPHGEIGREAEAHFEVVDRDGVLAGSEDRRAQLTWAYADDRTNDFQERDREVDRAVARIYGARARQEAVRLNRGGDYGAARSILERTARRILSYAGSDPELRAMAMSLQSEMHVAEAPMPEMMRKATFAASAYSMRARTVDGKAFRRQED